MDQDNDRLDPDVAQALARAVDQVDPPAALRDRVLTSIGPDKAAPYRPQASAARALPAWLATAALLAIAAGLAVYVVQLRARVTTLEQQLNSVLIAPDLSRVELAGQVIAPQATARAFFSRSRGLVFTAVNLPALPAGRTYQLWIVTTGQTPVSVGLLKPDAQGQVNIIFNAPPDAGTPAALAVTIEPDGGVPAPTGDKYLVGSVS